MTGLFASTQTSQLIPSDGHDSNLDSYGGERGTSYPAEKSEEHNEALEEEDNARPPYWHVSDLWAQITAEKVKFYGREATLTRGAVDDRRWHWWDDWRYPHAFNRYRQNSSARRPEHTSEIYLSILVVFDNLPTRRPTKRSIWRADSSLARIISRDPHFLWHIRIHQTKHDRCGCKQLSCLPSERYVPSAMRMTKSF